MEREGEPPPQPQRRNRRQVPVVERQLAERNIFSGEPPRPLPSIRTMSAQQRSGRPSPEANITTTEDEEDDDEEEETSSAATTIRRPPTIRASGSGEIAGGSYFYAAPADYTPPPRQPKAQRRHTPPETEASLAEKRTKVDPATSSPEQGPQEPREPRVSQPGARAYSQPPRSPSNNSTPATTPSISPDRRSNKDLYMEELGGESAWTDATSYATFANNGTNRGANITTPTTSEPQPSTSYAAAATKPPSPSTLRRTSSPKATNNTNKEKSTQERDKRPLAIPTGCSLNETFSQASPPPLRSQAGTSAAITTVETAYVHAETKRHRDEFLLPTAAYTFVILGKFFFAEIYSERLTGQALIYSWEGV
ncbi:unnamed protein product, partial [Iphiclides podalirius]